MRNVATLAALLVVQLAGCSKGDLEPESDAGANMSLGSGGGRGNSLPPASGGTSQTNGDSGAVPDLFVPINPNCPLVRASGSPALALIDDLEDGDWTILANDGRDGDWAATSDNTAGSSYRTEMASPSDPGNTSAHAVHSTGAKLITWGAVVWMDLVRGAPDANGQMTACPYDASAYEGLRFKARGNGPVRVMATMIESIPVVSGGICAAADPNDCWNDHGTYVTLGPEWQEFTIRFSDLMQHPSWGFPLPFNPAHVEAVRFQTDPSVDFDYWLDDVGFLAADQ